MKSIIISLSLVIILILAGCKDNSTQPLDTSVIWPLKVGNNWVYYEYGYSDSSRYAFKRHTYKVQSDTIINGFNLKKIDILEEWIGIPDDMYLISYYLHNEQGLYNYIEDSLYLWCKYPANKNELFIRYIDTAYITSVDEKVTVQAGTFICYVYKYVENYLADTNIFIDFYSPGIGKIKTEYYKDINGEKKLISTLELVSYKIN